MKTKCSWMGEDIESLPREKLIEIIKRLASEMDQQRHITKSILDFNNMTRAARR